MFYETSTNQHGLPHNPFKAIVVPRPIGWIGSSNSPGQHNLAPYSYFNAFSDQPPIVGFSSTGYKDSVRNIDATGNFTCNFVSAEFTEKLNVSSAGFSPDINEFDQAGIAIRPSKMVDAPGVEGAAAILECRHLETKQLADLDGKHIESYLVLGQVVGIYIDDGCLVDGKFDSAVVKPIARLGYLDYTTVEKVFSMRRPNV
jgi:flavin reductase (DIM6/NTAB) family NADH-FMN oxidoreductase RutF